MKPKILLATTCRWFSAARLAIAFSEIGSTVEMVGPLGHPALKTTALSHRYSFRGLAPVTSFHAAIDQAKPDLIVACDDLATSHLHRLYSLLLQKGEADTGTASVLRRSLGPHTSFPTLESRSKLMDLARSLGVRTPETSVVTKDSLSPWLMQNGFPAVLKADGSAGGLGVQVVRTMAMAENSFAELSAPPLALRAVKRALFDQDRTLLKPSLKRTAPVVNAQVLVEGRDATFSVACWEGEVVASISLEVIKKQMQDGPSSVVRLIDHPEMSQAAEKIVRKLGLSGFFGFDFILGEQNNFATLIEMNARATQVCHLALGTLRDLPLALAAMASGEPIPASRPVSDRQVIALFPQEWHSDPTSEYLATAFHDVPWREPRLVKASVDFYTGQKKWYSPRRMVELYRKVSTSPFLHHPIKPVGRP
jgi:formate-dependent phosphoribosylglycinamide formyltransferase (GAR transformylase)